MIWINLKKGPVNVHFEYNGDFTNNIFIYNTQICIKPKFILKFDINPNLKKKNKLVSSYTDTIEIIERGLETIKLIQIDDKTIIKGVARYLSDEWNVIIELKGEHFFKFMPELNNYGIFLRKSNEEN